MDVNTYAESQIAQTVEFFEMYGVKGESTLISADQGALDGIPAVSWSYSIAADYTKAGSNLRPEEGQDMQVTHSYAQLLASVDGVGTNDFWVNADSAERLNSIMETLSTLTWNK